MFTAPKMKSVKAAKRQSDPERRINTYISGTSHEAAPAKSLTLAVDLSGKTQHLARLARPIEVHGTLGDLLTLPVIPLPELPESLAEIAVLRASMNQALLFDFRTNWLSVIEREQWDAYSNELFLPRSLTDKWDRYLLKEAAPQYGAKILLSDHVIGRVWAWASGEERGSRKLADLFKQISKAARVGLKLARGSITPQARRAKDNFVPEISELQKRLRADWPDSAAEVRRFVAREIEISPSFVYLKKNAPQFIGFLGDDHIALDFRGEYDHITLTPTQVFIKWLTVSKNRRSQKSVEHDLSYVAHRGTPSATHKK